MYNIMSPDRIVPIIPHTLPALAKPFGTPPLSSVDCFVRIRPMIPHVRPNSPHTTQDRIILHIPRTMDAIPLP